MQVPILRLFGKSPFEDLKLHANKVEECTDIFKRAVQCYIDKGCGRECREYEQLAKEISALESEADSIKRRMRGHTPKGLIMPVDKFQLFMYLREQDKVLDAVEDVTDWLAFRTTEIPEAIKGDIVNLVDKAIEAIKLLDPMIEATNSYFRHNDDNDRKRVKELIREIRQKEHEADRIEKRLKRTIYNLNIEPLSVCHLSYVFDKIGEIVDHAENAGDMMRAMVAR